MQVGGCRPACFQGNGVVGGEQNVALQRGGSGRSRTYKPLVLETNALPFELPNRVPQGEGSTLRGIVALTNKVVSRVDLEAKPTARLAWSKSVLTFGTQPEHWLNSGVVPPLSSTSLRLSACRSTPTYVRRLEFQFYGRELRIDRAMNGRTSHPASFWLPTQSSSRALSDPSSRILCWSGAKTRQRHELGRISVVSSSYPPIGVWRARWKPAT